MLLSREPAPLRPRRRGLAAALRQDRLARSLALFVLALSACRAPEGAAQRYRRFVAAARDGDGATVWALLSSASQERIRARSAELSGGAPTPGADLSGPHLVLGDLAATAPRVKSVRVASQRGDEAVVDVDLEGGGHGQVTMRREQDGWRVVMPGG